MRALCAKIAHNFILLPLLALPHRINSKKNCTKLRLIAFLGNFILSDTYHNSLIINALQKLIGENSFSCPYIKGKNLLSSLSERVIGVLCCAESLAERGIAQQHNGADGKVSDMLNCAKKHES
jgi:hypothetical protein